MDEFWHRNVIEPGKLPPLLALFTFIATFLITRGITRLIRAGRGPFRDNVTDGGVHIHHSVPGLFLMVVGAFTAISVTNAPWVELSAVAIGAGTSLVLDEFALILHLKDVYWSDEGRISIEIVGLAAASLAFVTVGFVPFGVDHVDSTELAVRVGVTGTFVLNMVMLLLCVLKGKYRMALFGVFVPLLAWVSAIRMARPRSWWARHRYRGARLAAARTRDEEFQARWDPRWERVGNLIAGRPSSP